MDIFFFKSRNRTFLPLCVALLISLDLCFGSGFCAQHVHDDSHAHHHHDCDNGHDHSHHHDHEFHRIESKLPEELAEEEDMKLYGFSNYLHHHHHHSHTHTHDHDLTLTGLGLWLHALGCSLLVSLASLVCLIILPIIFIQGKPSKAVVDSLALFGAGAMLGDAFLHQLPHAFGGEHSHSHDDTDHSHNSHSHSLKDLSVGLSILAGIVLFLLVEKVVRYVEANSSGAHAWGHGHHHHHLHNSSKKLKDDDNVNDVTLSHSSNKTEGKASDEISDDSLNGDVLSENESLLRKHNFTDGMALGSAFLLYGSVGGWSRTLFLLAHELPQEIGDFGILIRSGFSASKALFFNFLSALLALAGTALALLWGQDPGQSSLIEGFTAGGFIYIAVAGVLAEMNNGSSTIKSSAAQIISLMLGMAVALCISLVE
ncbi:IAA-alanine resistance protein 1 isoform X2 [Euphorbia lathyris]|uniref:IAA-alanine resistance protein 1 isoform X2 n=1 Tax=Euphorbia lathyris TaxID=212925 RepID=UPI003313D4FA